MSLWTQNDDLTYVTDMSEFIRTPRHPETGEVLEEDELKRTMVPHIADGELKWWYGTLDSGARVLIYND